MSRFICMKQEFDFLKDPVKNGADKFKQYGLPIITSKVTPEKLNEGSTEIEGFKFNVLTHLDIHWEV